MDQEQADYGEPDPPPQRGVPRSVLFALFTIALLACTVFLAPLAIMCAESSE
jgi:hypothetical protein